MITHGNGGELVDRLRELHHKRRSEYVSSVAMGYSWHLTSHI